MAKKRRSGALKGHGRADAERIAEAVGRPGIDPRAWVTLGRSDSSPEARRYDPDVGWIVDVAAYGSAVHGTVLPCRVASGWPGLAGYGDIRPPGPDEEIVVLLPGGDPDEDPIAIGVVANGDGGGPPEMVAGRAVIAEGTTAPGGPIAATDCEFSKSPYSRVEEHEGERHLRARFVTVEATMPLAGLRLGSPLAHRPIASANELVSLLGSLIDEIVKLATSGLTSATGGPVTLLNSGAVGSLQALKAQFLVQVPVPGVVVD
jgi:hypothetical protein